MKDFSYPVHQKEIRQSGLKITFILNIRDYSLSDSFHKCMKRVKAKPFSASFDKQCGYFGSNMLELRFDAFIDSVNKNRDVWESNVMYRRAVNVLMFRLRQTENLIWNRVG